MFYFLWFNSFWACFIFSGLFWRWRWEGVHLQGAKIHPSVRDIPEAPQALLGEVWTGECEDDPGLWKGNTLLMPHVWFTQWVLSIHHDVLPADQPQRPGLKVCVYTSNTCDSISGGEGARGQEDRFWEVPQHPPVCLWNAFHHIRQEARRGGGAVQTQDHTDQWVTLHDINATFEKGNAGRQSCSSLLRH